MQGRLWVILIAAAAAAPLNKSPDPVVRPQAVLATESVPHSGDAADDPAIWLHPTDPARSLILGTDKQGGLHVYNLDGKSIQIVNEEAKPNNVDVLYGFALSNGQAVDLAIASTRGTDRKGVKIWSIDARAGRLTDVTAGRKTAWDDHVIPTFDGHTPYGIGGYRSTRTGRHYFFVSTAEGQVEQYELHPAPQARVQAKKVREFRFDGTVEGIVADEEYGWVYFANEPRGIWKTGAEPDDKSAPKLIARTGEHLLKADVEGLAIYYASDGKGYLIASSQGNNTFKVYRREGNNEFVCTIDPRAGELDGVQDTDGIAVTNSAMGPRFPRGFFIVQDGNVPNKNQNFKVYRWEDIAGDRMIIDTAWDPRKPKAR